MKAGPLDLTKLAKCSMEPRSFASEGGCGSCGTDAAVAGVSTGAAAVETGAVEAAGAGAKA